jgi:hypothetical protein
MMDYPGDNPGVSNQKELQDPTGLDAPARVHTPTPEAPEHAHESARVAEGNMEVASAGVAGGKTEVATPEDTPTTTPANATINKNDNSDDESKNGIETEHTEIPDDEVYHPITMMPSVQSVCGLRPRRVRDYSHRHAFIVHHTMTQYSLKRVLKKFKDKGEEAASKELEQLHLKQTFTPQDAKDLTTGQKKSALESLTFLKENRDGAIKGRACADGRKKGAVPTRLTQHRPWCPSIPYLLRLVQHCLLTGLLCFLRMSLPVCHCV